MFNYPVSVLPPFTTNMMNKICGSSQWLNDDHSLFMTMTALFYKRIPNLQIFNKIYTTKFTGDFESHMGIEPEETLAFYWFPTDEDPEPKLKKEHESFNKHDVFLTKRLGQNIYIKVYNQRKVAVFYENLNLQLFHAVQALTCVCFRKYFDEDPLTEKEKDLMVTLTATSDIGYKREIQNLLQNESLKRFLLKPELTGMEKDLRKRKYDNAMAKASDCLNRMHSYLESYREACEQKNEYEAMAYGLKCCMDEVEEHTEFEDYLCENKLLTDIRVKDGKISFIVKTFVNPYLPDEWDSLSKRGRIFEGYSRSGTCLDDPKNLKLLLDAIFSKDHTLKLKICGYIILDYFGSHVSSSTGFNFTATNPNMKDYVPNAHLNRHNCFGQNMDDILNQLQDGDLIGAVECCINVVKRINVAEGASFVPFVESIKTCAGKCIVTEDGQEFTPVEAVKYLKEKNDETTSDNAGETDVA